MSLKEYARKRDFRRTAEPEPRRPGPSERHRFVIQKHAASRLHYDFRLELGGALKSWAVPKGVPYKKGERRLAVQVEDHPVDYIDFEGTIPQGQYGGGTVMVWDTGTFEPMSADPKHELAHGKLHFILHGKKLRGEWYLVRLRDGKDWLLIKGGEDMAPVSARRDDTSAISRKSMAGIARAKGRVWDSNWNDDDGMAPVRRGRRMETRRSSGANRKRAGDSDNAEPTAGSRRPAARTRSSGVCQRRDEGVASPETSGSDRRRTRRRSSNASAVAPHKAAGSPTASRPGRLRFVEPMKALLVDAPPSGEWVYEIKFDGFRALALRDAEGTRLLSRNNNDFAAKFPEVARAVAKLAVTDALVDGEIVALDEQGRSSFQLLQAYELGEQRPPVVYYVFDLLQLDGRDLRREPLAKRRAALQRLVGSGSAALRFSASLGSEAGPLLEQARKLGLEGLIGKRADSPYETGRRSGAWIKLKLHQEQEFVIGGYTPPGGAREHFGALLVGYYAGAELRFAGKVGTGFDRKRLGELHARFQRLASETCSFVDLPEKRSGRYGQGVTATEMRRCHWIRPELVAQLKFAEWTRDGRLRQPVFLGLREDKPAREVVREQPRASS